MNRFSVLTEVPEFTKGLVRELRVRWALEEMGMSYEEIRYPHSATKREEYKKNLKKDFTEYCNELGIDDCEIEVITQ